MKTKLFPIHYSLFTRRGFTLVELLVVIAMIGILTSIAIGILNPGAQLAKGNDSRRKSDLAQISKAIEQYYSDHGRYPGYSVNYQIVDDDASVGSIAWGGSWPPSYMDVVPKDPVSSKSYVYYSDSNGQSYWLYASLDRAVQDSQHCMANGSKCANAPADATCGSVCSYGISSPNTSP